MTDTSVTPNPKNYSSLNFPEAAKNGDLRATEILVDQGAAMQMKKVFAVMNLDSHFIGVYSCRQKAQEVVDRLKGEFLGSELIIEENVSVLFDMEETRLMAQHKHKYLKGLSASQINDLYQDDPFDQEVELQASLGSKVRYSDLMSISINSIIAMKNYKLNKNKR